MTSEEKAKITDLKKCDFTEMAEYFKAQSEARKAMTKEEKLVRCSPTCIYLRNKAFMTLSLDFDPHPHLAENKRRK